MLIPVKMKLKPLNMLGKYALILAVQVTSLKHYYFTIKRWVFLERPKHSGCVVPQVETLEFAALAGFVCLLGEWSCSCLVSQEVL